MKRHRFLLGLLLAGALLVPVHAGAAAPSATVTGIPLDAPWKSTVYALARAAFPPYQEPKTEHGDVAALKSEPILRDAGFPMAKFPAVQAAMRDETFDATI